MGFSPQTPGQPISFQIHYQVPPRLECVIPTPGLTLLKPLSPCSISEAAGSGVGQVG